MRFGLIIAFAALAGISGAEPAPSLHVTELRCEYLKQPMGIPGAQPRLFWKLESRVRGDRQTAYQILAATREELLEEGKADRWDSKKVDSGQSTFVRYAGLQFGTSEACFWKVRVWDAQGRPSAWSQPANWTMGVVVPEDWRAKWIESELELLDYQKRLRDLPDFGMEPESVIWEWGKRIREMTSGVVEAPAVCMRREFDAGAVRRATLHVSGLGLHEVFINGERVGDHQLDPAYTDYSKRVMYATHDVTGMVGTGRNAVGVVLGNGWYNLVIPHVLRYYAADYIAPPKLLLKLDLEFSDGTRRSIVSDADWKFTTDGPIRFNNILSGETYDARREMPGWNDVGFDATKWKPVRMAKAPTGRLVPQLLPPVRVTKVEQATSVTRHGEGWRFDIGQETAGWARLRLRGKPGREITVHYPGSDSHTLGRYQTCKFICASDTTRTFESRFSYNGFRYVDVRGIDYEPSPSDVEACLVGTDFESAGEFSCSDERLNKLQQILRRTIMNYVQHIPNDPTREKAGWTQDVQNAFHSTCWNFLAAPTYIKWQRDFLDAIHPDGYMPPVVPGRFDGPTINGPWWGGCVIYGPWFMYQFYGDREILAESLPAMVRQFDYLTSISKEGIVEWGLGDWLEVGSVRPKRTPVAFTSTCAYAWFADILRETSTIVGQSDETARFASEAETIKAALNAKFLDPGSGVYAQGSQTSQLLSLVLNLAPHDKRLLVLQRLVERIAADNNHLTTGFVGTPFLLNGLAQLGHPDLAWSIATQTDYPSFIDAVLNRGNTVMKEDWKGGLVQMPSLQGPIGAWYFQTLAGIQIDPKQPGFKHVILKPETTGTLQWVKGRHESLLGPIVSEWRRVNGTLEWKIALPPNTTATAYAPCGEPSAITEGSQKLSQAVGVTIEGSESGRTRLALVSGEYLFRCPAP